MRKFDIIIVVLASLLSFCLINSAYPALIGSTSISTQGTIDYGGNNLATLKFATGFESIGNLNRQCGSDLSIKNEVTGTNVNFQTYGDGSFWNEPSAINHGITPYDGSHCLGGYIPSSRLEILLVQDPTAGYNWGTTLGIMNQFYLSEWQYFPVGWKLSSSSDWQMVLQITGSRYEPNGAYYPLMGIMIEDHHFDGVSPLSISFRYTSWDSKACQGYYNNSWTGMIRGGWNHIEWFQTWSTTSAECWAKWNGHLLWHVIGTYTDTTYRHGTVPFITMYPGTNRFQIDIGKLYGPGPKYAYWDDWEIWDGVPK
jgi:hypothetical protein